MAKKPQLAFETRPWRDSTAKPFVRIRNVTKKFGDVSAVDDVSLDIFKSELFCLLGGSGSGKSTLLRMLAGFEAPTSGTIEIDGQDMTTVPPYQRPVNMMFQSYALFPHMNVEQNIAYGLKRDRLPAGEIRDRVAELLTLVKLQDYGRRKPNQLSGGQQQRVALARALVIRPDVLLLDEPLSNLDAKLRLDLRSEIRRICKSAGLTTVYVTHDQKEALSMADRIAIMKAGKIQQVGTPQDLYRNPDSQFVASFLGETNFIEAKVAGHDAPDRLALETGAGKLLASIRSGDSFAQGQRVLCSIRPESIRLVEAGTPGALPGKRLESIYLGEIAQHQVRLGEQTMGQSLAVSELNPTAEHLSKSTTQVGMHIDPRDVVILPMA